MKLKKGQIIYIDNNKYIVVNMVEYQEDTWIWQEYEIVNNQFLHRWLSVEKDENNQVEYYLFDTYVGRVNTNEIEFSADGKVYELYEKGQATVKDYFGDADVDKYEKCDYFDYISQDKTSIISIEKWDGETEKSVGAYLEKEKVRITQEIDHTQRKVTNGESKTNAIIQIIIFGIFFLPFILTMFSGLFVNKSMMKYLDKEKTKYTYVTSVTNNTNNKKAKVYKSSFSTLDLTVKDIIDGVPEGITKVTDSEVITNEDGIGLQTKKEYAYVYEENGKIYIQVSSIEYVNSSGTMYHSHHHHYYYGSFTSNRTSSVYNSYANSARQRSVNSRTSSGGGTSSGK